jgi:hypothetical protein
MTQNETVTHAKGADIQATVKANLPALANMTPAQKAQMKDSRKAILSDIATIQKSGAKFHVLVHSTAVKCMEHAHKYGDVTLMQKLYQALPKSFNMQGLRFWVSQNSPIRISGNAENAGLAKETDKGFKPWNVEHAKDEPFYEMKEVANAQRRELAPFTELALVSQVISLPERAKKAITAAKEGGRKFDDSYGTPEEMLADLDELVKVARRIETRCNERHETRAAGTKRSTNRLIKAGSSEHAKATGEKPKAEGKSARKAA